MTSYGEIPAGLSFIVEIVVAVMIMVVFVISSIMSLKERHRDLPAWHVFLGAAIYGAVFGLIIAFVIMPLRMFLLQGGLSPRAAAFSGLGLLFIVILLRRGLIGRLPFLGPQVKAFRRASLRRTIEVAQKQLDELTPVSRKK